MKPQQSITKNILSTVSVYLIIVILTVNYVSMYAGVVGLFRTHGSLFSAVLDSALSGNSFFVEGLIIVLWALGIWAGILWGMRRIGASGLAGDVSCLESDSSKDCDRGIDMLSPQTEGNGLELKKKTCGVPSIRQELPQKG
jgi:hypothetical protein